MMSIKLSLLLFFILLLPVIVSSGNSNDETLNPIDKCWRRDPNWDGIRRRLAYCSIGFAGKMTNNVGKGLTMYTVENDEDHPTDPKPGSLRYGATVLEGKVWIDFAKDMVIKLQGPLVVNSYTTIDGRGAKVEIAFGDGFMLYEVTDVIIHGLHFHHNVPTGPVSYLGTGGKILKMKRTDGDAVRLLKSSKVWVDHNTFSKGKDGLLDVTLGSTDVTVTNNWFHDHDKVMLLGHDDSYLHDRKMRVTVAFNRFGPGGIQRLPRVRHGYVHVANNLYDGWEIYAIGGSAKPTIRSESNYFIAPNTPNKDVTRKVGDLSDLKTWNWRSLGDEFVNGAFFSETGSGSAPPGYSSDQKFDVAPASHVKSITENAGALTCKKGNEC